jgi:hypothetical protein
LPFCNSDNPNGWQFLRFSAGHEGAIWAARSGGIHLKFTSDEFLALYWKYGFSAEITTAYELEELERKPAAEATEEVFDKLDRIRAHAMGVRLA